MKRWISAVLAILLLLTGCGARESATIVGEWEQEINVAGGLTDTFVDEQAAYFLDIENVPFYTTVTFREDGTYSMALNTEKSEKGLRGFIEAWYSATLRLWEALLEQNESEATIDDMLEDFEDYHGKPLRETLSEQIALDTFAKSFTGEGKYRVEGDKLYRNEDAAIYETILFEENMLYILSSSDPNLSDEDAAGYPYKFKRIS